MIVAVIKNKVVIQFQSVLEDVTHYLNNSGLSKAKNKGKKVWTRTVGLLLFNYSQQLTNWKQLNRDADYLRKDLGAKQYFSNSLALIRLS